MSTYSMADVVALTNIKAPTLRKWETRYGFLEAKRTDTNIRYYTDDQLRMLLNIGILLRNGFRISRIDKMSSTELHGHVSQILLTSSTEDDVNALILAMLEMKEAAFNDILERHINRSGPLRTMVELVYPFLNHVGVLWGTNKAMPAQEHFVSNLIRQKLLAGIDAIPLPKEGAPKIILFLMEGEIHEMGLLLAYYIAKELGWKTYYLGQNVPQEDIHEMLTLVKPQLLMTMVTIFKPKKTHAILKGITDRTPTPIAVSGGVAMMEKSKMPEQVIHLKNPDEFVALLNEKKAAFLKSSGR